MPEEITQREILNAMQSQTEATAGLADEMREMTQTFSKGFNSLRVDIAEGKNGPTIRGMGRPVEMPIFISILGGLSVVAAFVISSLTTSLDKHIQVAGDLAKAQGGLNTRVAELVIATSKDDEREDDDRMAFRGIAEWQNEHDRRVLSLNTAQSKLTDIQTGVMKVLWSNQFPDLAFPEFGNAPRLEP